MAGKGKGLEIGKKITVVEKPITGNDDDNTIDQSTSSAANRINGGVGNDAIYGSAFADRVNAGDGDDTVMGGAGDDVLFGNDGDDTAAYEGSIFNFTWEAGKGGTLVVTDNEGDEGTDTLKHFENLQFGDYTLDLDGVNAAMILGDADLTTDEDNSGGANITAWDFDGGVPTINSVSVTGGGSVSASTSSAGTIGMGAGTNVAVTFDPGSAYQYLAVGESTTETITVVIDDGQGNLSSHDIIVTIEGSNDAPTASAIVAPDTNEDAGVVGIDLLSSASDVDASDDLDVDNVTVSSSDGRTVIYSVDAETGAFSFDAGQFNDLAVGESATVTVAYDVIDGNGGSVANTAEIVVEGRNDAPVVNVGGSQTAGTVDEDGEDAPITASGQLSASDVDTSDTLSWSVSGSGNGTYGQFVVDQNGNWTYTLNNASPEVQALEQGDSFDEVFSVVVTDNNGATDTIDVTVTVTGSDDNAIVNSYNGTPYSDYFYGYDGNTSVEGYGGNDHLIGDYWQVGSWYDGYYGYDTYTYNQNGSAYIYASDLEFGDDIINTGTGYDTATGDSYYIYAYAQSYDITMNTGNDQISGDSENDTLMGDAFYGYSYGYYGQTGTLNFGDDVISGDSGYDNVAGDTYYSYAYTYDYYAGGLSSSQTNMGNDIVSGGSENDRVSGDTLYYMTAYTQTYYSPSGSVHLAQINAGDDVVSGDAGNDVVTGDAYQMQAYNYNSYYYGSGAVSTAIVEGGDDIVSGGDGYDRVYGDGEYAYANAGYSYYYGSNSSHTSIVSGGDDHVSGGADGDSVYGDFYYAYAHGAYYNSGGTYTVQGGNDVVEGGAGNDNVYGDFYYARAYQYGTNEAVSIVSGDDIVNGGTGNDSLWGDAGDVYGYNGGTFTAGADVFVFDLNSGLDNIRDFNDGLDLIDVSAYGFSDWASLSAYVSDNGYHSTIDLDGTAADVDEIFVYNTTGLGADDFIFA